MSRSLTDGGRIRHSAVSFGAGFDLEELRRRNLTAVVMDLLYLFTTAFFALLIVRGLEPAVIAALPLAALLYFGWKSSRPFFAAQALTMVITAAASYAGVVPL